jgi:CHAD domain-containing protein
MKDSAVSLSGHESLQDGLLRVMDDLVDSAAQTDKKSSSDAQSHLHRLRTTIKRMRALLRLVRPVTGETFFRRENERLKYAAGCLSAARDKEVASTTLSELPISNEAEQLAIKAALSGFEGSPGPSNDLEKVIKQVKEALALTRHQFHRLDLTGAEREVIESGLRTVYRQSRNRMKMALRNGDDEAFHRWRIRVKNLYYELQFLESIWPKRLGKMVSLLSKLQDKIGLDHDLAVVKALLRKTPNTFGGKHSVDLLVNRLDEKSRRLRRKVRPNGRKVLAEKPGRFLHQLSRRWSKRISPRS